MVGIEGTGDDPLAYDGVPDCAENADGTAMDPVPVFSCDPTDGPVFIDCNGNLIDDLDDIAGGTSVDAIDWDGEAANDDVPDECQNGPNAMSEDTYDELLPSRCEFNDVNCNEELDIVEPWEDFLRRWDACIEDLDASVPSGQHWIKVYDPRSDTTVACSEGVPPEMETEYAYNDPIYIYSNYPGNTGTASWYPGPTDSLVARAGNGVFNPSDSWSEVGNTKMQWQAGPGFATTTPLPGLHSEDGQFFIGDDVQWYPDAWQDRYVELPRDFYHGQEFSSETPAWPSGENPNPEPPGNEPGLPNTPRMEPFQDRDDEGDVEDEQRYFQANRGGLHGDGTGWLAAAVPDGGPDELFIMWETGLDNGGFEDACTNCFILPEEMPEAVDDPDDDDQFRQFYDGLVEHDDLPSSKYHFPGLSLPFGHGDKKLGEATGTTSHDIWGQDRGDNNPDSPSLDGDTFTVAGGPYAVNVHGSKGRDGGNVLLLEWLSHRTDGTAPSYGTGWEWVNGPHEIAGPGSFLVPNMNFGFRDYNLDGMIDQGEVRPELSENYSVDSDPFTNPNLGTFTNYPFNRQRLVEDVVEALDASVNWNDFVVGNRVSGIVLVPPDAYSDPDRFPFAPRYYPIHTEENSGIRFHDLVICQDCRGFPSAVVYAAHEYGHTWEGWVDLYDYDRLDEDSAAEDENCPIGLWDIMADGALVHPNPVSKAKSEWIQPIDLETVLVPGVEKTITLEASEFDRVGSYYFLKNVDRPGERFYFWSVGSGFDEVYPGKGMLIMHTFDATASGAELALQQRAPPF
ncbi:MAG: hypothetical protein IID40_11330, partial [Planctomycetes bacterium]|nr:hypothetical protein [Planctomycetota bacterium]